jgi:hypothetical protein
MNHSRATAVTLRIALQDHSGICFQRLERAEKSRTTIRGLGGIRKNWSRVWTNRCEITTLQRCDHVGLSPIGWSCKTEGTSWPKRSITPIVHANDGLRGVYG